MADFSITEPYRKQYEGYYDGESEWRRLSAIDKAANLVELCGTVAPTSILEIGAGEGALLARLAGLGFGEQYYALEVSPSGLEVIQKRGIPSLVECRLFDGYLLPYADAQFDLAVMSHVLEHVEYPRKLIYEAMRVAAYVFIEVPLEYTLRLPKNYSPGKSGHINFYSPALIRRLAQTCGLKVIRQVISNPSREVYRYRYGRQGIWRFHLKQIGLKFFPALAVLIWPYHSALLCARPADDLPA